MKWILHNFWIKLLAVLMAFLLWLHVATERIYEIELNYRLDPTGLAGDLVLVSPPPASLTVRCRGSGKRLLLLMFRERVWQVDLSPYTRGVTDIQLSVQEAPRADADEVQFLSIVRNDRLHLEIDRKRQKTVPIISVCLYEPRAGFVRAGPEILDPDSVVLSGPVETLKAITMVKTRSRTFANLSAPVDVKVELEPSTAYSVITSAKECRLYADIQPYEEKTFDRVQVSAPRMEDGTRPEAEPASVSVTVGGGQRALGALPLLHVRAGLDTTKLVDLPSRRKVLVQVPPGFRVVHVQPDSVLARHP